MTCQTAKATQHTPPTTKQTNTTNLTPRTGKSLEGVAVLVGLGLSERQAQVFMTLLRAGDARARPIASAAGVPRQEVYGLLLELQHFGLVRQNLTVPATYSAIPFIEASNMLFEQKANELTLISRKAKRLTEKFSLNPPTLAVSELFKPCFGIVSEGARGKKYSVAIQGAQRCIEVVSSWVRFRQLCFVFEVDLKVALKRGVRVRVVAEKQAGYCCPKWVNALSNSAFELRTMPNLPAAVIAIFDGVQVAVGFDPSARLDRGPDLWSTHAGLVAVCRGYFDGVWAALE